MSLSATPQGVPAREASSASVLAGQGGAFWAWAVSLALSLWAGVQIGSLHPDEVFQFLEPANHLAFGFGWMSWEWTEGIRNWAVPGALAGGMKLIHLLGWTTPWGHRFGASLVVAVLSYPGIAALLRYAERRLQPSEPGGLAVIAVFAIALWGPCLMFLGRTMGESMGALFGMAAIEALDRPRCTRRDQLMAGVWLGCAVVVRYTFAAFIVGIFLQLLLERRWRQLGWVSLGGVPVALAVGALDWATWGAPFHSMIAYVTFNLSHKAADEFGKEPWWFFARVSGWTAWPMLAGAPWIDWRRVRTALPSAVYLAALSITPHKEGRFIFPVVLWTAADMAPAFVTFLVEMWRAGRAGRRMVRLALATFTLAGAGAYYIMYSLDADVFRATIRIGEDPGLTGMLIAGPAGRWGSGGNFYLGRPVDVRFGLPGEEEFEGALKDPGINRALVQRGVDRNILAAAGFKLEEEMCFGSVAIMAR